MSRQVLNNLDKFGIQRGKINDNFSEVWSIKLESSDVLTRNNTDVFFPTNPYEPATKQYADDIIVTFKNVYDPDDISKNMFVRANHVGQMDAQFITQDTNHRFVSDLEKTTWNDKESAIGVKNTAFNKNFGVVADTVSEGDHNHSGVYEPQNNNIQTHIAATSGNPHDVVASEIDKTGTGTVQSHIDDVSNPHEVTKAQVGLGDANNTNDANKPISTATQTALDLKRSITNNIFGDQSGGNYSQFANDGTLRLHGNATAFKDMIMDIFARRLNSTTGKVDYDWANNAIKFQSGGGINNPSDRIQGNQEINHEYVVGSNIIFSPHIHWFQKVTSHSPDVLDTKAYEITLRWRIVRNGYGINLTTPSWTTIVLTSNTTNNIFTATNAGGKEYISQLTLFPNITVDCNISDTIQMQMARTDSLGGDMLVYFMDVHGAVDSFGSETIISKV